MTAALYNDNDAKAAAWLLELIAEGLLPAGQVSTVSIKELAPDACADTSHFFAGIGGWPLALEIAGWPAEQPVWTGSCPCQPFSAAGKRAGADDPRHLWPDFLRLIRERRPPVIFGEQVASSDGRAWLAGVRADLEAVGYAVGAADLCSAGIGAPHIRQRLYWGAKRLDDTASPRHDRAEQVAEGKARDGARMRVSGERRSASGLGNPTGERWGEAGRRGGQSAEWPRDWREFGGMADADLQASGGWGVCGPGEGDTASDGAARERSAGLRETGNNWLLRDPRGRWRLAYCRDDRWRRVPVEPALFPLADGLPGRVGLLRGAGNAIDPWLAARFVGAFMEAAGCP